MPALLGYSSVMRFATPTKVTLDLDRDGVTVEQKLVLWRDAMRLAGTVHVPHQDSFSGTFVTRAFGDMRIMRGSSATFRVRRDSNQACRIRPDHVIVNLVERGRFVGQVAGRRITVEPGAVLLSRLASPLDLLIEDAEWFGLFFPRNVFEKHMVWTPGLDARVLASGTANAALLGGLLRSLDGLPDPLPVREASSAMRSSLSLIKACLGSRAQSTGAEEMQQKVSSQAIRRFISERLADADLGLDLICREFSVSRSGLYRLMGDSANIAEIIRRMRLRAVHRHIVSSRSQDVPLAEIGRRWGLTDERNFRRAFVQEFGYPPSFLRKQAQSGEASYGVVGSDLERWFLGL